MKTLYTVIFLLVIVANAPAQSYHPLVKTNTTWDVMHTDGSQICNYDSGGRYFFDGDTIINNLTYSKIKYFPVVSLVPNPYCPPFAVDVSVTYNGGYLREDTINKKVYKIHLGNEALLYDFNLIAGDTLKSMGYTFIVDSTGTIILLNGDVRKIIYLNNNNQYYIEGIGGSQGLGYSMVQGIGSEHEPGCVIENGVTIWNWGGNSSSCLLVDNINEFSKKNSLKIFPNPTNGIFTLNFPAHKEEGTVEIYDVLGKLIVRKIISPFSENLKIDFTLNSNGVYYAKINWLNKSESLKFIKD